MCRHVIKAHLYNVIKVQKKHQFKCENHVGSAQAKVETIDVIVTHLRAGNVFVILQTIKYQKQSVATAQVNYCKVRPVACRYRPTCA